MERLEPAWGRYKPSGMAALALAALKHGVIRGKLKKPFYRFIGRYGEVHDVEHNGIKLRCHLADNATERAFLARGARSRGLLLVLRSLKLGNTFVDVGANCGVFSAYAAREIGPDGRVISIEPNPVLVSRLRFNVAANGFRNVTIIESALGEGSEAISLRVPASNFGAATIVGGTSGMPVRMMTMAAAMQAAEVHHIDVLKIDVEGYEDRVLLPYLHSMPRAVWPKRVLIETVHASSWRTDCVAALENVGYRETWRDGHDSLLVLKD